MPSRFVRDRGNLLAAVGIALMGAAPLLGCKARRAATTPPAVAHAGTPDAALPASAHDTRKDDEAAVRAIVAAWIEAQNAGRFEAYQELYARKFQGVRRSGPRVRRFNREGWMADRARMFASPMKVSFAPTSVLVTGAMAVVDGTQTWASATYKDTGPKRLVLFREAVAGSPTGSGAWKIAREELLASAVDVHPPDGGERYWPVYEGKLVFESGVKPEAAWFSGPPVREGGAVIRQVAVNELPQAIASWKDKTVRVFDKDGGSCTARVGAFQVRTTAQWHFGTVEGWREEKVPDAQVIADILGQGTSLLEAELVGTNGTCRAGVVALPATRRAPVVAAFTTWKGATLTAATREAQRTLPAGDRIATAAGYEALLSAPDITGARSYYVLVSNAEMCTPESIGVDAAFVWRGDGRSPGKLLRRSSQGQVTPVLLIDLDDDGDLELVYEEWPSLMVGFADLATGATLPGAVDVPYFDCPC